MKTENNILNKVFSAIALFGFLVMSLNSYGQCNLACNSDVQVSLDNDCSVMIMPDMVLEGDATAGCDYTVELELPDGTIIPNATVTAAHIGMTITAKITDQTQNSCWGSIRVEDKLAPVLTCPADVSVLCYEFAAPLTPSQFISGGFLSDNCGDATVTIVSDVTVDIDCADPMFPDYSAIRTITYIAQDASGNFSNECSYDILYERVDLFDPMGNLNITFPADQTRSCFAFPTWNNMLNGMGVPLINGTTFGIFPNNSFCELNATFSDVVLDLCGAEYKVIREWTVLDWCSGLTASDNQIIKIEQGLIGFAAVQGCDLQGVSDPYSCTGSFQIPNNFFSLTGLCAGVDYTYEVFKLTSGIFPIDGSNPNHPTLDGVNSCDCPNVFPGVFTQVGGTFNNLNNAPNITDLEYGCNWINVVLTTECGQVLDTSFEVLIEDSIAPNPVCDQNTVVTVGNNGWAIANAGSFDDGSFDFCSDVSFGVRRLSPGCFGGVSPTTFGTFGGNTYFDFEKFCCEDIGNPVSVELVVVDESGNWSVCTVEVFVQDLSTFSVSCPVGFVAQNRSCGQGPAFTSGPTITSAICTNFFVDGPSDSAFTPDDCGDYSLVRSWFIRNSNNNQIVQTCTQNISVTNTSLFNGNTINFPGDRENLMGCINTDTSPSSTGSPSFSANACSLVAATHTDQTFTMVDDACFKILRTWTVIDWCQYDPNNPSGGGIWQDVQVIKVNDNTSPTPIAETVFIDITSKVGCQAAGSVSVNGNDNCGNLTYSYSLNGGPMSNPSANNNFFNNNWTEGTHTVTWTVFDACGNSGTTNQTVIVDDVVAPTPFCIGSLSTVLMESTGMVTIWASDFDPDMKSTDNCSGNQLNVFFGNGSSNLTFDCDDLGVQTIQVFFEDESGNSDFCTVEIDIQDNLGACMGTRIAGEVYSELDEMVDNVEVNLHNMNSEVDYFDMTASGEYEFLPVDVAQDYQISAARDDNYMNGVSTLDLVLIQKHILSTQLLDSPYKVMAADINSSGNISAIDLVELRKLILGIYTELPNNDSWRFVDASQSFADANSPWPFTEVITINQFSASALNEDFVAIKVGDVNNTAAANATSSNATNRTDDSLDLSAEMSRDQDLVTIDIKADNYNNLIGFQTAFNITEGYEFEAINAGELPLTHGHINPSIDGALAISYNSTNGETIAENATLFSIVLRAKTNNNTSTLTIGSEIIQTEAYTHDLKVINITLRDDRNDNDRFTVFQNTPNPFKENTTISFNLPESAFVTMTIYDVTGRTVAEISREFNKGFNSIEVSQDDIRSKGILYYRIDSGSFTATKKMISL
jgi:hypothetical protein